MALQQVQLYDNPGIITTKLPENIFSQLRSCVRTTLNSPVEYNEHLIGQMEEEYTLPVPTSILEYLSVVCREYQELFGYKLSKRPKFTDVWVNMQKKHEYNPNHQHYKDIGWVVWINIPYKLEDEFNHLNCKKTNKKRNSLFEFVYSKLSGEISTHQILVDKTYEGTLLMFPGTVRHSVYPFYTSEGYRISVAGNIDLVNGQ